ncbi:EAL domain-containing protein [Mycobacterium sp. URHB0044]|uniref:putative bifunctional diguanylate cyclase/phosphodiesterase n=1 Tax=Mycobacterium sp. URHB0044 TaxID=1380386 RepID=UPI000684CD3A
MAVDAATSPAVSQQVLGELVAHFDVNVSFLRHNDHRIHATRLIAEWPPRPAISEVDPLELIYFADADPVFALAENLREPTVFRAESTEDYQRTIEEGRQVPTTSMACVPLLSGEVTTGVLGFVKFGIREWSTAELNALMAIASLFAQVQARVEAEDQLRYLAEHDDLTGLHNRRALLRHLEARLMPGQPGPVSALFIDLDRLKAINDYLGHTAGDRFIRALADRLEEATRGQDMIARLGGDEFVVVPASPLSTEAAEALGSRLQSILRERVTIDGEMLTRTVSIGVALGMPGRDTTSDLIRRADQAVLTAKGAGGNQVAVFSAEMSLKSEFRNDIELHLQSVIENGALFLRYLPEIDMRTGEVLATEALVRWQHPTRGLLSPASFIAVAESINLAGELGRWVMRTACAEFARWRSRGFGLDTVLRLNVSPVQLVSDGFVESVASTLREFDLEPGSVCLEITESVVVQDLETTSITLAGLKRAGVQLAIDDFGTGYSVFSHLKALPVDLLKIDRGFVADLGANPDDLAIVRAIIALAEAFGLQLVAEGVETEAAAVTLLRHGCHRAQGFLLSHPLSGEDMEALLAKGRVPVHFSVTPSV